MGFGDGKEAAEALLDKELLAKFDSMTDDERVDFEALLDEMLDDGSADNLLGIDKLPDEKKTSHSAGFEIPKNRASPVLRPAVRSSKRVSSR